MMKNLVWFSGLTAINWVNQIYRKFMEILTILGIWATLIILQNDKWKIWATLDLLPAGISQNMDLAVNLVDATSRYFQKTWATLNPKKLQLLKCFKILRIYGNLNIHIDLHSSISLHQMDYSALK